MTLANPNANGRKHQIEFWCHAFSLPSYVSRQNPTVPGLNPAKGLVLKTSI